MPKKIDAKVNWLFIENSDHARQQLLDKDVGKEVFYGFLSVALVKMTNQQRLAMVEIGRHFLQHETGGWFYGKVRMYDSGAVNLELIEGGMVIGHYIMRNEEVSHAG